MSTRQSVRKQALVNVDVLEDEEELDFFLKGAQGAKKRA